MSIRMTTLSYIMPVTVRLDEQTEKTLDRIARERGVSRSEVIRHGIRLAAQEAGIDRESAPLSEILGELIGSIRTGESALSEQTGRRVRQKLARVKRT